MAGIIGVDIGKRRALARCDIDNAARVARRVISSR